jgi:hypothetical protein
LEEEKDPFFIFLSFFPFDEETAVGSYRVLEFLEEGLEGERWLEGGSGYPPLPYGR